MSEMSEIAAVAAVVAVHAGTFLVRMVPPVLVLLVVVQVQVH